MIFTAALAGLVTLMSAQTATPAPRSSPPSNAPVVSTEWLQSHLNDPTVRVIVTGDQGLYDKAHIPGARFIDHMGTLGDGHRLLPPDALAAALAKVGAADGTHVVLYGDSPMTTGWLFMAFASIGHAGDVSMLDGGVTMWQEEGRATTTADRSRQRPSEPRPAPDVIVDAAWDARQTRVPGNPCARCKDEAGMDRRSLAWRDARVVAGPVFGCAPAQVQVDRRDACALRQGRRSARTAGGHVLRGRHAREPDVLGRSSRRPPRSGVRRVVGRLAAGLEQSTRSLIDSRLFAIL
jgi:hypothetical protein